MFPPAAVPPPLAGSPRPAPRGTARTGRPASSLAREADGTLDVSVSEEACPLNLAPTASTTATLAMGDALATALLEARGYRVTRVY